jgi:hypothetical protein
MFDTMSNARSEQVVLTRNAYKILPLNEGAILKILDLNSGR